MLLFALGVLYYGGISNSWPNVALAGVLHRIAACYVLSALIYVTVRSNRGIAAAAVALLVGYWALLTFVPIPDLALEKSSVEAAAEAAGSDSPFDIVAAQDSHVTGRYEEGVNVTNYVDFLFLRGRKPQIYYINEGLLSTLPAIALPLFGILAGRLLKNQKIRSPKKIQWLFMAGALGLAAGLLWSVQFPLIKRIWTSSFVLVAAGLSAWLLALFYYVIDVRNRRRWSEPFVWIGCNALVMYLAHRVVPFHEIATYLVGGDIAAFFDRRVAPGFGAVVTAGVALVLIVLLARFLYRQKVLIRV